MLILLVQMCVEEITYTCMLLVYCIFKELIYKVTWKTLIDKLFHFENKCRLVAFAHMNV